MLGSVVAYLGGLKIWRIKMKMDANEFKLLTIQDTGISLGKIDCNPYSEVIIQTQDLKLLQTDLGLTIDIPFSVLSKIETIEINGIKFKKENHYD